MSGKVVLRAYVLHMEADNEVSDLEEGYKDDENDDSDIDSEDDDEEDGDDNAAEEEKEALDA